MVESNPVTCDRHCHYLILCSAISSISAVSFGTCYSEVIDLVLIRKCSVTLNQITFSWVVCPGFVVRFSSFDCVLTYSFPFN